MNAVKSYICIVLVGLAASASGCDKKEDKAKPDTSTATKDPVAVKSVARAEKPNYIAEIKPKSSYAKGKEDVLEVVLTAKPGYHTNKEYPYKFATNSKAKGVTYPKATVGKDNGTLEETKLVLKVPFTPTESGDVKVGGLFHLSVCSEKTCEMGKENLEVAIHVQ
jgi:hypothetical protein